VTLEIGAIYEAGVLKLDEPLPLPERQRVTVTVREEPREIKQGALRAAEFDKELDALSADLRLVSLPPDLSRSDMYLDHECSSR